MKPVVRILAFSLLFFGAFGCEEENIMDAGPLTDSWTLSSYEDSITVMARVPALEDDTFGFVFGPGGAFIEHNVAGWCATPPVVYNNYEGRWSGTPDSLINIHVGYWGGTTSYTMEILSVDQSTLRFIPHYESSQP